jgi:hypothetical protein
MTRAERRAQRARAIARAKRNPLATGQTADYVRKLAITPTPCSCWMCGNPRRRHNERTLQELRATQED